ncbi:uncharacterized protein LOC132706103 [Cylas formicarius]|uniref:uncharacterized protein LOC132706103 n=1 Tax=Cylas formicarius TaxID=197179 RepID=UPI002958D523|nr:uncharacterized protein LOC132706103 [Cylas formicarius]
MAGYARIAPCAEEEEEEDARKGLIVVGPQSVLPGIRSRTRERSAPSDPESEADTPTKSPDRVKHATSLNALYTSLSPSGGTVRRSDTRGVPRLLRSKMSIVRKLVLHLGFFCLPIHEGQSFRLTNMTAPPLQDPRKDMPLHCRFDLGGEELYAVKWYKDDQEFFRYTPSFTDSYTRYPVPGVLVDTKRSRCDRTKCDLLLTDLARPYSSGAYRCEVSSEAPAFRLASQTQNVTVAAIPDEYPAIEDVRNSYVTGELLYATCTSGPGDPKPNLKFYVNKQAVPHVSEKVVKVPGDETNGRVKLQKATIQLHLLLDKKTIPSLTGTSLEISCISSTEGISPLLSPPLASSKNVMIINPNQNVNNQKFHWPQSSARTLLSTFFGHVLLPIVVAICC